MKKFFRLGAIFIRISVLLLIVLISVNLIVLYCCPEWISYGTDSNMVDGWLPRYNLLVFQIIILIYVSAVISYLFQRFEKKVDKILLVFMTTLFITITILFSLLDITGG